MRLVAAGKHGCVGACLPGRVEPNPAAPAVWLMAACGWRRSRTPAQTDGRSAEAHMHAHAHAHPPAHAPLGPCRVCGVCDPQQRQQPKRQRRRRAAAHRGVFCEWRGVVGGQGEGRVGCGNASYNSMAEGKDGLGWWCCPRGELPLAVTEGSPACSPTCFVGATPRCSQAPAPLRFGSRPLAPPGPHAAGLASPPLCHRPHAAEAGEPPRLRGRADPHHLQVNPSPPLLFWSSLSRRLFPFRPANCAAGLAAWRSEARMPASRKMRRRMRPSAA